MFYLIHRLTITGILSWFPSRGGRYSAALVGTYLGYLAEKNHGNLTPGITLHFWGDLLLGVETILISQRNQGTSPQGGISEQFNY